MPVVSLDALFWKPGWQPSEAAEFEARLTEAIRMPRWIMDGDYIWWAGDVRRSAADAVVWFDLPRWACMVGIMSRIATSYGRVRPEMAQGCPERINVEFFRYVWTYRKKQRPTLVAFFEGLRPDQTFVTFTNRAQADRYLSDLAPAPQPASAH